MPRRSSGFNINSILFCKMRSDEDIQIDEKELDINSKVFIKKLKKLPQEKFDKLSKEIKEKGVVTANEIEWKIF